MSEVNVSLPPETGSSSPAQDGRALRPLRVAICGFGTVGSSVARILTDSRPAGLELTHVFNRGVARKRVAFPAFEEAVLGGSLILGSFVVFATNWDRVREINLFGCVLLVQSLPFLAAAALAAYENCRFNDFALLQSLEARLADIMAPVVPMMRRSPINRRTAAAEKRMEAAP